MQRVGKVWVEASQMCFSGCFSFQGTGVGVERRDEVTRSPPNSLLCSRSAQSAKGLSM